VTAPRQKRMFTAGTAMVSIHGLGLMSAPMIA
jgi:hypothetical protein